MQIENGKNNLIKLKNDLIERFKKNDRRKKADRDYYEYEENKFHGLKDVRNLFNQNDDDDNYEGIEYLFDESIMNYFSKLKYLEYEEIKKLLSVKPKKELIECVITKGIIKQEEAIDYDVNYYRCNYRKCEKVQGIDYFKYKPSLINDEHREVEKVEIIKEKKVESCKIIKYKKVESCEIIEEMIESYELLKEETIQAHEIIEEEIIDSSELIKDKDYINKLIEDKNDVRQLIKEIIESCKLIEDQEDISELIEYCELNKEETIDDQKDKNCEIIDEIIKDKKIKTIRHQKVEDINMLKS